MLDRGNTSYCLFTLTDRNFFVYITSPSFDTYHKRAEWGLHTPGNISDYRPDSATSSVRSQDSGVAQSDPKTSHDFSAKSETSSKLSTQNTSPYLPNVYPSTMIRHRGMNSVQSHLQATPPPPTPRTPLLDSSTDQIREKLQPLNTQRLKTLRQATKSFIVNELFLSIIFID